MPVDVASALNNFTGTCQNNRTIPLEVCAVSKWKGRHRAHQKELHHLAVGSRRRSGSGRCCTKCLGGGK
jgi:hypothetical protein